MAKSPIPMLDSRPRDLLRFFALAVLQFYALPMQNWWMIGIWAALVIGGIIAFKRLGESVHDSLPLTAAGLGTALAVILWPLGLLVLTAYSRSR